MERAPGRRGSFLLVALLLVMAILLEQYLIVRLLPWLSDLGGVQPMIVFLDIPLRLPVISWIPVGILFIFFYLVAMAPEFSRHPGSRARLMWQKGWSLFAGWWVLLLCIAATGGTYSLLEDQLPRAVRNGIDSFGFRADIALPWPGDSIIHLHGGMIMLIALLIGGRFFLKCAQLTPVAAQEVVIEPKPGTVRPCVVHGILEPH